MREKKYYGVDTEFLQSGRADTPDVHSIQISDGETDWFFETREELNYWFRKHALKTIFTWTTEAEFGSFKAWEFIGVNPYDNNLDRISRFWIERPSRRSKHNKVKVRILDIQPFFKESRHKGKRLGSLKNVGEFLSDYYKRDLHKLEKPLGDDFGMRAPETKAEKLYFRRYANRDANIVSWAAKWLQEEILDKYIPNVPLQKLFSWGTVAKHFFKLPKLHIRMGRSTILRPWHRDIYEKALFAGRNEAFATGYLGDVYYNDIASLYPIVTVWLHALEIRDVKSVPTPPQWKEAPTVQEVLDFYNAPYAWIEGRFKTENDLWGLPKRGDQRNYYIVGEHIDGMYHTYDLLAAKAKIEEIDTVLIPQFVANPEQARYQKLTMKKLEHDYASTPEKYAIKGTLNSLTGKLGQAKPQIATTSNFPAYSTILAGSHYLMAVMFDQFAPVYYTDTDSFFSRDPVNKEVMTLTSIRPPHWTVPVIVEVKGESDELGTIIFRSKHYYQSKTSFAFHGWKAFYSDWFKVVTGLPDGISVQRQIARTFRTRDHKAQDMQIGRWKVLKERYTSGKLKMLFRADDKRVRFDYGSYKLAQEKRAVSSKAWNYAEWRQYINDRKNLMWLRNAGAMILRPSYLHKTDLNKTMHKIERLKYQLNTMKIDRQTYLRLVRELVQPTILNTEPIYMGVSEIE